MFYVKDKIIPYPNKTILADVLSREGEATINCFSPFKGLNKMLRTQFSFSVDTIPIMPEDIAKVSKDFSSNKWKETRKEVSTKDYPRNDKNFTTKLEDIEDEIIEKYVLDTIIKFKQYFKGQKKIIAQMQTVPQIYQEEEGVYIDISDFIQKQKSFSVEEMIDAKNKLPFLLKQMHRGSILYKGSLLSFIIAIESYFKKNIHSSLRIHPRDIILLHVYQVDEFGNIIGEFSMEDTTGEIFTNLFKWVCGKFPNDIYYQGYVKLMKVLTILGIDITKENPFEYPHSYISKIKNNKNQFILSDLEELPTIPQKQTKNQLAKNIAINCERLYIQAPNFWYKRPLLVNSFLSYYSGYLGLKTIITLKDFDIEKGFLKTFEGVFMPVNVSILCNGKKTLALLSITGHLVLLENYEFFIHYLDLEDAIYGFKGGNVSEWKTI